jgi:hypothetical protein
MKKPPELSDDFVRDVLNTTPEALIALYQERRPFEERAPQVGDHAPDFALAPLGGGELVRLSSFRGVKPVALIFGSYT